MMGNPGTGERAESNIPADSAVESIRKIAESEAKKQRIMELAVVTSIYPHNSSSDSDNYECDVKLKDGSNELRKVPIITSHIGMTWVPAISDLVLVGYIGGSVNSPVVIGSMYSEDQRPPLNDSGEMVFESPDPQDSSNKLRRIYLKFPSGMELTITDKRARLKYKDTMIDVLTSGDMFIGTQDKFAFTGYGSSGDLNVGGAGDIKLFSKDKNIKMESEAADAEVKAAMNITINAGGGITIETGGALKLKGTSIKIESDSALEMKGVTVSVSGDAMTEIKGGIVKIN